MPQIHHVTGEGEDKGVVYCEMQGRENTGSSLVNCALASLLYPDPSCGLDSETGGKMSNLRDLTVDQVMRRFYPPLTRLLIHPLSVRCRCGLESCGPSTSRSLPLPLSLSGSAVSPRVLRSFEPVHHGDR